MRPDARRRRGNPAGRRSVLTEDRSSRISLEELPDTVRRDRVASEQGSSGSQAERRVRGRQRQGISVVIAVVCLAVGLIAGAFLGYGLNRQRQAEREKEEILALSEEQKMNGIKESLSEGNSVLRTLRRYYPEDLVMYRDDRYVFLPVDHTLKMHSMQSEKVRKNSSGEWQYEDKNKIISHKGIDVSSHQGTIDWAQAAGDGVEFAIIRAMYRGYVSGKLVEDKEFRNNISGALANGVTAGVYVFTQAITREEVEEEVEMLKGLLADYEVKGPVVVDVERTAEGTGRMDLIDADLRTDLVGYFCQLVKEAGYRPMIYYNIETALLDLDLGRLEDYEKWFASYNSDFYFPYDYTVWQYTDKGNVSGINTTVDLDMTLESF